MFVLLFACTETTVTSTQYTKIDPPSEYSIEFEEESSPEIDLASLETAFNEALLSIRDYNTAPMFDSYHAVMEYSDSYCPTSYELNGNAFWYGQCESDAGMYYDGYLFYNIYEELDFFGDGGVWDVYTMSGATDMLYPSMERVHWGGSAYFAEGHNVDGYPVFFSNFTGSFWDQSSPDWLSEAQTANLMMYGIHFDLSNGTAGNGFYIQGNIDWSGPLSAISFQGFTSYTQYIGFPCEMEPIGTLSLRTAEGQWIDVEFDNEQDWSVGGECDGCGTAYHNGEELGDFCIDNQPMLDWEDRP